MCDTRVEESAHRKAAARDLGEGVTGWSVGDSILRLRAQPQDSEKIFPEVAGRRVGLQQFKGRKVLRNLTFGQLVISLLWRTVIVAASLPRH